MLKKYGAKLPENGSMIRHITYILELKDKLLAIGETINDSQLSALLLCLLLWGYNTLIIALEASYENKLISEFIKNNDEYNRRIENADQGDNSAFKAFKTPKWFPNDNNKRAMYIL